ncbi:MAG TPA: transglutaminase-like domain-containing protein [Casimicrobiaceae bacterium]|nr:transglutaminase-like domain-containing protein [Casimicrobiaceae bacterium]
MRRLFLAAALAVLLAGCQSLYFQRAGEAPSPPPQYALAAWPDHEYWSGIVFNGEKIGFSHTALHAEEAPGEFEIRSEAAFVLRFLGFDKRINLKATDVVRDDLDIVRFRYDYVIDNSEFNVAGTRKGNSLVVTVTRGGEDAQQTIDVSGPLYPQAASAFYPLLHGLAPGREYRYPVYSGELQKITEITQHVLAYERSPLFEGSAFRLETAMEGYKVETWVSARGAPLLEIAMNGVLISGLEDEARARNYLAAASLNKSEALIAFALVRPERPLGEPRSITAMRIALRGADRAVPSDEIQRCVVERDETICTVRTAYAASTTVAAASPPHSDPRYLASTFPVPARDPRLRATAREIAGDANGSRAQVERLLTWIRDNVRTSPADVWTALDVLETREAECQGHTYLYAALARSLGIPTRVVNGIVYSADFEGFLYHTWAESLIDEGWIAVDPTFGTVPADATHVKLVEGETLADLTPLVDWIGRLSVRVLEVERAR